VGYLLRMSDELHDWLTDLQGADRPAAMQVGQALAALMSEGAGLGPPLVVPAAPAWPEDLVADLDASYQHRLDRLQALRRRAAEAAGLVKDMKGQVDELESAQARLDDRRRRALDEGRPDDAEKAAQQLAAVQREATVARQLVPLEYRDRGLDADARAASAVPDGCLPGQERRPQGGLHGRPD
jgi:hypothetical protein